MRVPGLALLGFPSDEGVRRNQGRVGAAQAPRALRSALAPLAYHQSLPLYDAGDVAFHEQQLEAGQRALGMAISELLQHGHQPLVLGGGHETAWGTFQGLIHDSPRLGIINLDAHFDLRTSSVAHSGTPFAQMAAWCQAHDRPFHYLPLGISRPGNTAALWQRADDLGIEPITDVELSVRHYHSALPQIESFLHQMDALYLSIDLDVLPGAIMPAVSAPAGLGVPLEVIIELVERIAASGKLLAADVVEYNPLHDVHSMGAKAAARIIWELCYHWKTSP